MKTKEDVINSALRELNEEAFREAVEQEKEKIRATKWWHKYIPYKIMLIRR
jgi:hypothetical protein